MKHLPNAFSLFYSSSRCCLISSIKENLWQIVSAYFFPPSYSIHLLLSSLHCDWSVSCSLRWETSPKQSQNEAVPPPSEFRCCSRRFWVLVAETLSCSSKFCTSAQPLADSSTTLRYRHQFNDYCWFLHFEQISEVRILLIILRISPTVLRKIDSFSQSWLSLVSLKTAHCAILRSKNHSKIAWHQFKTACL